MLKLLQFIAKILLSAFIIILLYLTFESTIISYNIHKYPTIAKSFVHMISKAAEGKPFILISVYKPEDFSNLIPKSNLLPVENILNQNKPEYFKYSLNFLYKHFNKPIFLILKESTDGDMERVFSEKSILFPLKLIDSKGLWDGYYSVYEYKHN